MASSAEQKQFINTIAPIIQEEAKAWGYKVCSPIIAQACCESAYGTSWISKEPFWNMFGMKCGSSWKGPSVNARTKEEYTPGTLTTIRDNFRAYPGGLREGVKGYFSFINTKRYANLKTASTPREYLELIKKDGYATSSAYVNTCMNYIARHDLERFDWNTTEENPYTLSTTLIRYGDRGESVAWMQWELCRHGYDLKIDKIYGKQTKLALLLFQKDHHLKTDALCGKLTIAELIK